MTETTLLLLAGGLVLMVVLVAVVLFMLNRSWGDSLPSRIDIPTADAMHHRAPPGDAWTGVGGTGVAADDAADDEADIFADDEAFPDIPDVADHPRQVPEEGLMLIEHPLLLQVIERAVQEGGSVTHYVVREGEHVYLSLDAIANPVERRQAAEMIHNFQTNNRAGVWDMIHLATLFGRMQR
jgi:hypothetical protein